VGWWARREEGESVWKGEILGFSFQFPYGHYTEGKRVSVVEKP